MDVSRARSYRTVLELELRPGSPLVPCRKVIECGRAPTTDRCIALARLRYLPRFQRSSPALLQALVWANAADKSSWISALELDLQWLMGLVGASCAEVLGLDGSWSWMRYAAASNARWKTLLRKAQAEHARRQGSEAYVLASTQLPVQEQRFLCGECQQQFSSQAALNTHFGRKHLVNVARRYAEGSVCRGCMVSFTSRDHVIHHLAVSRRQCLDLVRARCQPLSEERAMELQREDRARRRALRASGLEPRQASWPAHRVPGPLLRQLPVPRTPPGTPPESSDDMEHQPQRRHVRHALVVDLC